MDDVPFWKKKTLAEMSPSEWESLCDGCGKCCLNKLEYDDTGEIDWTNVACRLLDHHSCRCKSYAMRKVFVEECVSLTPDNLAEIDWLPPTCGYRLVSEGRDLYWWHPLVSGDPDTVRQANVSVQGKTRPEGRLKIPGLMKRIKAWPEPLEARPKASRRRSQHK